MEDDRSGKRNANSGMITVAIFALLTLLWFKATQWYGNLKYWQGHLNGMQDGAAFYEEEVQQYLPWNASGEWLAEWADARLAEEALSGETENFLKLKYDDAS
jgi:hypothetical protein